MAEAVLCNLATDILKLAASITCSKIQLVRGARGELQSLKNTMETIQAVLLDAEKQQWHNNQVKRWLKRLKDVMYDVQDLFDDVATEDLRRKVTSGNKMLEEVRVFFSKSNPFAHRLRVADKIRKLRKKLNQIKGDEKFGLKKLQRESTLSVGRRRRVPFFEREEEIIGREEDKKQIVAHLLDSSSKESVSVVAIVGIGGQGKTTLADLVYRDENVKNCFELKVWVCHGDPQIFDVNLIVKEILQSANDECQGDPEMKRSLQDIENKSEEQLQRLFEKVLDGKKYLLVLDDLWNDDRLRWLKLRPLLMGGSRGSKILITTRNWSAVQATDANSIIHDLRGLSEDKSWDLFKKMAFGDGEEPLGSRLEEVGRAVVKKCDGVPLAIKTIGSLLYTKKEKEWLNFKELELSKMDMSDDGIMEVLKLSYDHLLSHLKHCFAYCAIFPKDYVFDKQTMILLWMAQGFIESLDGNDDLEEIGERYVSDLVDRSFLEVEEVDDSTSGVKNFKMHYLLHDLALKVAGDECKMVNLNGGGIRGGIRHVSLASEFSSLQEMTSLLEETNLHSFFSLKKWISDETNSWISDEPNSSPNEYHGILSKFKHCRTLALANFDFFIPPSLGSQLKHLRFLDVSENRLIERLPDSITELVNLQTLNLSFCRNLTTLPRDLKKLINLRHLLIDGCSSLSHMPCGLNHLSSLHTLSQFIVQKMDYKVAGGVGRLDELDGLNRLAGSITFRNLEFLQTTPSKGYLREKQRLRSLELEWSSEHRDDKSESDELVVWENLRPHPNLTNLAIYCCKSRSPPSWLSSIRNLVELELKGSGEWKYLPPLSELPSLKLLDLQNLNALEFVEEISEQKRCNTARPFFPSLEAINIFNCSNLKGWWGGRKLEEENQDDWQYDSHSSFPKLWSVEIISCPNLNSMPLSPRIRDLVLSSVSTKLLERWTVVPNNLLEETISPFIPFSQLERLELVVMVDLEHSMLESLLPLLKNLKSMTLSQCHKLRSLSHGMRYLSSLLSLRIYYCEELDLSSHDDEHGIQWRSLVSLRDLYIHRLPKLIALPEGIQHVTTLESLGTPNCYNLMSLPE